MVRINRRWLAAASTSQPASACVKFAAVIASFLGRVQITSLTSPLLSDDETMYSCYAITDDGGGGDCATDVWRIIKSDGGRKARCVGETVIERGRQTINSS